MDKEKRDELKKLVSEEVKRRGGLGPNLDPEALSVTALAYEEAGFHEIASAFRNLRDKVVAPLLGEGWTVDRIELAMQRWAAEKNRKERM